MIEEYRKYSQAYKGPCKHGNFLVKFRFFLPPSLSHSGSMWFLIPISLHLSSNLSFLCPHYSPKHLLSSSTETEWDCCVQIPNTLEKYLDCSTLYSLTEARKVEAKSAFSQAVWVYSLRKELQQFFLRREIWTKNEMSDRGNYWHHLNIKVKYFCNQHSFPEPEGPSSLIWNITRNLTTCLVSGM